MPFDAQHALNSLGERVSNAPLIKNIVRNPFYTAILIAIILVIVILFVFRNAEFKNPDSEGLFRLAIRSGIYSLVAVTVVQFLQNQNVINDAQRNEQSARIDEVFDHSVNADDSLRVAVEPRRIDV